MDKNVDELIAELASEVYIYRKVTSESAVSEIQRRFQNR